MPPLTVDHTVNILDRKTPDGSIMYGTDHIGRPITIVQNKKQVVPEAFVDSPYVIGYRGDTKDRTHMLFDPYFCTLKELILFTRHFASVPGEHTLPKFIQFATKKLGYQFKCTDDEFAIIKEFKLVDSKKIPKRNADKRQTSEGVGIIRDIIYGLYALSRKRLCHGDLRTDNIVICISDGKVTAKLTRVQDVLKRTDYINLSKVIKECFSLSGANAANLREVMELIDFMNGFRKSTWGLNDDEWKEIKNNSEARFYKDPRTLLKNIFFWQSDSYLTYISYYRMLIDACRKKRWNDSAVKKFFDAVGSIKIKDKENNIIKWDTLLDDVVKDDVYNDEYGGPYITSDKHELIRYIRNSLFHLENRSDEYKEIVGAPPEDFFEYFRNLFPDLLLELHRVLQFHFSKVQPRLGFSYKFVDYL